MREEDRDSAVFLRKVFGFTPLHIAASRGSTAVVKMMMEKGADLNEQERLVAGSGLVRTLFKPPRLSMG